LTEHDHEGNLTVRCDFFINDVGPLGDGELPLNLALGKGIEFGIGQDIAAVYDLFPKDSIVGIGNHQANPYLRLGIGRLAHGNPLNHPKVRSKEIRHGTLTDVLEADRLFSGLAAFRFTPEEFFDTGDTLKTGNALEPGRCPFQGLVSDLRE